MEKKDVTRFGVLVAVVIVLAVLASFAMLFIGGRSPEVVLPPVSTGASETAEPSGGGGGLTKVEATPETVQNIIATLTRPESYTRTVTVRQYWPDETAENGMAQAATTAQVWVDGGWTRTDLTLSSGQVRHTLVYYAAGEETGSYWSWVSGQTSYYTGTSDEYDADLSQRIPTYEDVLSADPENILEAGYEKKQDVSCIYVRLQDTLLGYEQRYWVSVESGLLMAAETWDGETLVYEMSGTVNQVLSGEVSFTLPDGTVLHTVDVGLTVE